MTKPEIQAAPIRGKVAAIVSNRAIAVNRGSADGVTVGTRFAVLYPTSSTLEITDPETGELLGSVDVPKVMVKVFRVAAAHLCVARTYRRIPGKPAGLSAFARVVGAADPFGRPAVPDAYESLSIDDNMRIDRRIDPNESFVEIGDPAVQVIGDEFDGYSDYR